MYPKTPPHHQDIETAEFSAFARRHNVRMMKIILGIFLLLDSIHYFLLGAMPGGYLNGPLQWMIPVILLFGLMLGVWILWVNHGIAPFQEEVFILYTLGSRILLGTFIGFHVNITTVYVGLMLILSSLLFLGRRVLYPLLALQALLHAEVLGGWLEADSVFLLLITDVFAGSAFFLCQERYRVRLQAYFLNKSIIEKNIELTQAHHKITHTNQQLEAQQKELEQLSHMKDVVLAINHKLSEDVNLDTFLEYVLSRVREVIPHADLGCILLLENDDTLIMASSFGYNQEESHHFRLPLCESFAYRATGGDFNHTVIINDIQAMVRKDYVDLMDNQEHYIVQSSISGPIVKNNRLYGLINIDSKDTDVYTEHDIAIMEYLREQLGLALARRDLYREFVYLSKHDQLTGFLNRWFLREIETEQVPRWQRYGVDVLIAAMDLNDLKQVNDRLGHHEGDAYLRSYSAYMQQSFRTTDVLIRLGGDEFLGFFFRITEAELSNKLDDVNRKLSESMLQQRTPDLHLGFGYGITRFGEKSLSIHELMQDADEKMYRHKASMKTRS